MAYILTSEDDVELDKSPGTGPDVDNPCQYPGCVNAAEPYKGRGARPKFCADHKKGGTKSGIKRSGANNTLALQAAAVLAQVNNMATIPLMVARMPETAAEIAMRNDAFEAAALEALRTDPELCRAILKGGTNSGRIGLMMAYALMFGAVIPSALDELKAKRAAKRAIEGESQE